MTHSLCTAPSSTIPARRSYWTAWAATLTFFAGFYALLTPLPRYLISAGLPESHVGLVLGAFGIASLLGRPLAGSAADRWGARPVMLVGAATLLVGALGVLTTANVVALFGLRLLQAAGYVAFTTAGTGLIVAITAPSERGRRLAVFGAAANLAITLTPAAMSALLAIAPLSAGFVVAAGLALVAGLLAAFLPVIPAAARGTGRGAWSIPQRLWAPMSAAALFGMGFAAFFQFAPILAERRGTIEAGWLYTLYGTSLILTRFGGGGLVDRWGIAPTLTFTAALMAAGLAIFSVATAPAWLGGATVLLAASGLFHPALIAHHAALLPEEPGRASAVFYVGFDLGIGIGSWILGLTLERAGVAGLYAAAAIAAISVLPLVPLIVHRTSIIR